jgi:hypothetical protein
MQSSFVKIQDLIGYVSEYMQMRPMKQLMYANFCYDMDKNQIIASLCKFYSRSGITGGESEYIAGV